MTPNGTAAGARPESTADANLRLLSFFSFHDALTALVFVIFLARTIPIVGFAILFAPLVEFTYLLARTSSVPRPLQERLRSAFSFPARTLIRCSGHRGSHAISIPGLNVICLANDVLETPDSGRSRSLIAHEIGHLGRYDRLVYRWLQASLFATFIPACAGILLGMLILVFGLPRSIEPKYILFTIALFASTFYLRQTLVRVVHRREYMADLVGFRSLGQEYLRFLRDESRLEPENDAEATSLSHPSFREREKRLDQPVPTEMLQVRMIAVQWMLCVFIGIWPSVTVITFSDHGLWTLSQQLFVFAAASWGMVAIIYLHTPAARRRQILWNYSYGLLTGIGIYCLFLFFLALAGGQMLLFLFVVVYCAAMGLWAVTLVLASLIVINRNMNLHLAPMLGFCAFLLMSAALLGGLYLADVNSRALAMALGKWTVVIVVLSVAAGAYFIGRIDIHSFGLGRGTKNDRHHATPSDADNTTEHDALELWRPLLEMTSLKFAILFVSPFIHAGIPGLYSGFMLSEVASIISIALTIFLVLRWNLMHEAVRLTTNSTAGIWGRAAFTVCGLAFGLYYSLHIANALRMPLVNPDVAQRVLAWDIFSPVIFVTFASINTVILWALCVFFSRSAEVRY